MGADLGGAVLDERRQHPHPVSTAGILNCPHEGKAAIGVILPIVFAGTPPQLRPAASLTDSNRVSEEDQISATDDPGARRTRANRHA